MLCLMLTLVLVVPLAWGMGQVVGRALAMAALPTSEIPTGEGSIWTLPQTHTAAVTRQTASLFIVVGLGWMVTAQSLTTINGFMAMSAAQKGTFSPDLAATPTPPPPAQRLPFRVGHVSTLAGLTVIGGLVGIGALARRRVIKVALGREHLILAYPGGEPFPVPYASIDAVRVEVDGLHIGERWLPAQYAKVEVIEALGAAVDARRHAR